MKSHQRVFPRRDSPHASHLTLAPFLDQQTASQLQAYFSRFRGEDNDVTRPKGIG
jgi:hypothetical protein